MCSSSVGKRRNGSGIRSFITIIILIQVAAQNCKSVSCFWLTDGISFQPIANSIGLGQLGPKSVADATATVNQEHSKTTATVSSNNNIKPMEPLVWQGSAPQQVAELGQLILQQPPEWNTSPGGVAPIPADPTAKTTTTTTSSFAANQTLARLPVCQCNPDWLQSPAAGQWLSKWLNTASVANQLRWLMSNSTGASGQRRHQHQHHNQQLNHQAQPAKQQQEPSSSSSSKHQRHQIGGANGNHLSAWVRAKGNNGRVASGARSAAGKGAKWERSPVVETTTAAAASTTSKPTVLYERGPKGEQGPRGERGPSGLISVKDRDALFDLPVESNEQQQKQQQQQQQQTTADVAASKRARLAFVESEQMLVVDTTTGWRPVQMLPALRDFRKTIAKYSLNRAEDRRRLLTLNADQSLLDNSISDAANLIHRAASLSEISPDLDDEDDDEEDQDQDQDQDDDDYEDEDEDDDADADDELKDEDADEEDDDDDDDDDDQLNAANLISGPKTVKVAMLASTNAKSKAPTNNPKRRRAQVTGRSGAPTGQIMDNSISAGPLMLSTSAAAAAAPPVDLATNKRPPDTDTSSTTTTPAMKLRLIALNEPFSGNVHGLRGANFECKRHAARANIRGAFRAFLATNYQNLNEIVRPSAGQRYPIVNLRGETLADSWHDLFRSPARMTNPLSRLYSFDGRHVASDSNWPNKLVWHGSGNKLGHRDSLHNCDGWHSDSLSKFGYASPLHPPRGSHHNSANTSRLRHQRNHKRRFLAGEETSANSTQSNSSPNDSKTIQPVLDAIDKYPCRMPLIVLCVETIAQSKD